MLAGVLGVQGDVSEHVFSMKNALKEKNVDGRVVVVKQKKEIDNLDILIIPGGESTTISKILYKSGIYDRVVRRIENDDLPIMGTCAGCVLLAKELTDNENEEEVRLLHAMDIKVERNAFGRQRESFEKKIEFKGFDYPYNAVFIRAPIIRKTWGRCEILAKINKEMVVAVRQNRFLALSFHPELTNDVRIHKYFLDMSILRYR
ncbi:MAG: pyridoxal 5'-phosphate synthase glutaminase subunit PdxT [Thermoplasmata archaeon]|nr:MAG: pyridoxal 5'-phosphate synthase glutaminase subunit PdxT [Thermoplasmata archaeon]RLF35608.1 MAG: pyridoxal 5'-phosphate synthase glutaminase subunit PdxT [Thermoplasmata archaeon]